MLNKAHNLCGKKHTFPYNFSSTGAISVWQRFYIQMIIVYNLISLFICDVIFDAHYVFRNLFKTPLFCSFLFAPHVAFFYYSIMRSNNKNIPNTVNVICKTPIEHKRTFAIMTVKIFHRTAHQTIKTILSLSCSVLI